ncbi:MAG: hypothetical protein ACYC6N_21335 [Pirellulaceae bacterium]
MQRKEMTLEEAKEVLRRLGRHVVAIAGTYRSVDEDGTIGNKDRFFAIAVCLFAVGDKWFMITAGHCIDEYLKLAKSPRAVITGRVLVDYFGTGAPHRDPILYNFEDEQYSHVDSEEQGLDFALIQVSPLLRKQLEANGNLPLTPASWAKADQFPFESFYVFGFPAESSDPFEIGGRPGGIMRPEMMPVRKLADDSSRRFPRFKAEIIDRGGLKSVKGFSGGPIFGVVYGGGEIRFYVVAIQSRWDEVKIVFGCPIFMIVHVMLENYWLSQQDAAADSRSTPASGD